MKDYIVFLADLLRCVGYIILWPVDRFLYLIQKLKKIKLPKLKLKKPKKKIRKKKKKKRKINISFIKIKLFILGFICSIIFILIPVEIYRWFRSLPNPESLISESVGNKSTKILDRNGRLLYEIYVDKRFAPVELEQIPEFVIQATLAVEDETFYNHNGVRFDSMLRAAKKTIIDKELQGGSTITQQLIKNVLLSPERTVSRKTKEVILAWLVEMKYSKDEILEMYLNNIPYGGTSWGIQSASQKFFGKNVWELSISEATILAGLPSAPSRYSPLYELGLARVRQKHVLDRMVELNYLTQQEADAVFSEELVFAPQEDYIQAPHFVDFVRKELEKKYGRRMVDFGGLTVTTSLDLDMQKEVQNIVKSEIDANGDRLNISNGAAVVLDTKNSQILAYVGSIDYFLDDWGAYDVVTAFRQPGSSIKPVTYALALSKSFTPASVIVDAPVSYPIAGQPAYKPVNYDSRFHGNVTLRSALANSYNVPAVKLSNALGPDNIVSLGKSLGLQGWEVDGSYGLAVTLGGKEVRLLDLANVYGTFGRLGAYKEVSPFVSIIDSKGYTIYWDDRNVQYPISSEVSYIIWDILSDNNARTPAFGSRSDLYIPDYKVAVKTGTTDEKRDNWTIGFTPSYVVGVWVGNNNNEPMNRYVASGLSGASPIWNKIMTYVLNDKPDEELGRPENIVVKYDDSCSPPRREVFIKGNPIPSRLCPKKVDESDDKD